MRDDYVQGILYRAIRLNGIEMFIPNLKEKRLRDSLIHGHDLIDLTSLILCGLKWIRDLRCDL